MNTHSYVENLSILLIHHQPSTSHSAHLPDPTRPRFNNIHLGFFYLPVLRFYPNRPTRSVLSPPQPSLIYSRLHHSSISHSVQLFLLDLPCTFYRSDILFILSESTLPEQQRPHDNLSHNLTCCRLLFLVIFGAILFNSCDRILHHSGRIN